jgi:MFS family permease
MDSKNWVGYKVVIGVIIIRIVNRSVLNVFGLMFERFFKTLKSSSLEISFVSNLTLIIFNSTGIFAGFLLKTIPIKFVTIFGTICVSFGLILTSLVNSLEEIIITFSVLVGFGLGFLSISSLLAVLKCFSPEKRNQAVSLSLSGSTIGDVFLPQIVGYLLKYYGSRTAVFVVGVQALLGTIGAIVLFPSKLSMASTDEEQSQLIKKSLNSEKVECDVERQSIWKKVSNFFDLMMMKDKEFMILVVGIGVVYCVNADFVLILPLFLKVGGTNIKFCGGQ